MLNDEQSDICIFGKA